MLLATDVQAGIVVDRRRRGARARDGRRRSASSCDRRGPRRDAGSAATPRSVIDWAWVVDHLDELAGRTVQHSVLAGDRGRDRLRHLVRARRRWRVRRRRVYGADHRRLRRSSTRSRASPLFAALVPITGLSVADRRGPARPVHAPDLHPQHRGRASMRSRPTSLEAADGMGYTARRAGSARVELPLALPLIVAGLRLASVSTIGLVTVSGDPRRPLRRPRLLHLRGLPAQLPDRDPARRDPVDRSWRSPSTCSSSRSSAGSRRGRRATPGDAAIGPAARLRRGAAMNLISQASPG